VAQAPGQYLQADLARPAIFDRIALDSGGNLGEYARGVTVSASLDGRRWKTIATGAGTGQLTTLDVRRTKARYLRITLTAAATAPWSVADLRLYRAH
jgi:glucosylceramidase